MKGVFVAVKEHVDLLAVYGSAAILNDPFAYAFYVKDSTWRIDGPVGRDCDAFFGSGSAGRVDNTVRSIQRSAEPIAQSAPLTLIYPKDGKFIIVSCE